VGEEGAPSDPKLGAGSVCPIGRWWRPLTASGHGDAAGRGQARRHVDGAGPRRAAEGRREPGPRSGISGRSRRQDVAMLEGRRLLISRWWPQRHSSDSKAGRPSESSGRRGPRGVARRLVVARQRDDPAAVSRGQLGRGSAAGEAGRGRDLQGRRAPRPHGQLKQDFYYSRLLGQRPLPRPGGGDPDLPRRKGSGRGDPVGPSQGRSRLARSGRQVAGGHGRVSVLFVERGGRSARRARAGDGPAGNQESDREGESAAPLRLPEREASRSQGDIFGKRAP